MNKLFLSNFVGPKFNQCSALFRPKEAAFLCVTIALLDWESGAKCDEQEWWIKSDMLDLEEHFIFFEE